LAEFALTWRDLTDLTTVPALNNEDIFEVFKRIGKQAVFYYHCFGKVKLKTLPVGDTFLAHILPPCPSIIVLAMANPSPELFESLLTRKNASNI
jgi:hypothetical protein